MELALCYLDAKFVSKNQKISMSHNLTQIIILLLNLMQFQHLSMLVHVQLWFCSLSYFTKRKKIQDVNFNNLHKNTLKHSYSEAPRAYLDSLLLYLCISDKQQISYSTGTIFKIGEWNWFCCKHEIDLLIKWLCDF